jgi:tetratricopeptide (TPR) repeat protein
MTQLKNDPHRPKLTVNGFALWVALPMAQSSRIEGRLKMILDTTKRRTLTRPIQAVLVVLASGLALAVATAYSPPRSLEAAITSGGYPTDTPAHSAAEAAYLQAQIRRFGDKDPWAGKAYYVLGNAQAGAGRTDDALASFAKAIALPEPPYANSGIHSSAQYERINALESPGHYAEAVTETQRLLKNGGRGLISPDLEENLRERLSEFKMLRDYADKQAQVKSFYAAFPIPTDPRWTQTLPNGVTVSVVGCQQAAGNRHTAWTPEGRFLTQTAFERNGGDSTPMTFSGFSASYVAQEQAKRAHGIGFAVRLSYPSGTVVQAKYALPENAQAGGIESWEGAVTENGRLVTDEPEITRTTGGLRLVAAHFPASQRQVTLRVGIAVGDAPDPAYQWAEFPNITLPPVK